MSLTPISMSGPRPVLLNEVKEYSRITVSDDDDVISDLIDAATSHVELYCKRSLLDQIYEWRLDGGFRDLFEVPRPPLIKINDIEYIDEDGNNQILNSAIYDVDKYSEPARIVLAYDRSWPTTRDVIDNIIITLNCGYISADEVPKEIKQSILWFVDHWYEHRTPVSELRLIETPHHLVDILAPYRMDLI